MRFKLLVPPTLTVSLFLAALPGLSQTAAPYQGKVLPLEIGAGPSGYEPDWGHGRMYGGAVWADWYPSFMPNALRGLGVEIEARDISLDRHPEPNQPPRSGQANTKEDTAGGGFIYKLRLLRNLNLYGKGLISQGSVDFITANPNYSHDTRALLSGGGGIQYRVYKPIWARVDYEYQVWGKLLSNNTLTPQGFTVGMSYDFAHPTP
ncbi:MAG: outer membrane beta-barrel protein [Terracidiphilus sp.]|jgi:hypothetical protein